MSLYGIHIHIEYIIYYIYNSKYLLLLKNVVLTQKQRKKDMVILKKNPPLVLFYKPFDKLISPTRKKNRKWTDWEFKQIIIMF